ncbi:hypothetical protein, partial [Yersinia pseudotuberculosis]|uniref:hypothetical protein n=1 Tax=Yersinia pseudotuberculosis TaxID=633 RepID=UPI001E4737EA
EKNGPARLLATQLNTVNYCDNKERGAKGKFLQEAVRPEPICYYFLVIQVFSSYPSIFWLSQVVSD